MSYTICMLFVRLTLSKKSHVKTRFSCYLVSFFFSLSRILSFYTRGNFVKILEKYFKLHNVYRSITIRLSLKVFFFFKRRVMLLN